MHAAAVQEAESRFFIMYCNKRLSCTSSECMSSIPSSHEAYSRCHAQAHHWSRPNASSSLSSSEHLEANHHRTASLLLRLLRVGQFGTLRDTSLMKGVDPSMVSARQMRQIDHQRSQIVLSTAYLYFGRETARFA